MGRKVFLSVLGSGYYHEVKYYHGEDKSKNSGLLRFIQEANLIEYCQNWDKTDQAYFFVTQGSDGSKFKNWNKVAQEGHPDGSYEGLSLRIEKLNLKFPIEIVEIPDGFSEEEIWEIFEIVYQKLKDDDEIFFDVTHAFRSIPMLVVVLINYAKFLKNIKVQHILYGAFEKIGPAHKVKNMSLEDRYAPVLDLKTFSILQDWTSAANDFIQIGSVDKLVILSNEEINPILRETKGKNENAARLKLITKSLPAFIKNIQTCRGLKIVENDEGAEINRIIQSSKDSFIKPLTPILEKISEQIRPFEKSDNINNGFLAVKWCLNNGLIQQGITILKESITTLVCDECELDYKIERNRNIVDSAFKIVNEAIPESNWKGDAGESKDITKKIIKNSKYIKILNKEFSAISGFRNDINHAGFKNNSISKPERFEHQLNEILCNTLSKII